MRPGVRVAVAFVAAALAAAPAAADTTTAVDTTTSTAAVTTTTTTTAATTTAPETTTAPVTVPATTSLPAPTTAQTTTAPATTAPAYAQLAAAPIAAGCAAGGALAIVEPGRQPRALAAAPAALGPAAFPASGAVATLDAVAAAGRECAAGRVTIRALSLLGGAVTASSVTAKAGVGGAVDLRVGGAPVDLPPGGSVEVGGWGRLSASVRAGALAGALGLRLLYPRAGLPAGTVLLVGFAVAPPAAATPKPKPRPAAAGAPRKLAREHPKAKRRRKHAAGHLPLKATPPLRVRHYVFPVGGPAQFGDSYGGPRSDIADGWHHGDDIFAPLGTPVVAVADGTLNRVGWEHLGGWRLWLRDAYGNQFYYAHLAAYSKLALHAKRVHAGDVIGFLGRTGDAFTTQPHLHFEIHPRRFLHLHYDGAVDPTTYLQAWPRVVPKRVPLPTRPKAPAGQPRLEAAVVWRQLLAARGIHAAKPLPPPPHDPSIGPLRRTASAAALPQPHPRRGDWLAAGLASFGAVAIGAGLAAAAVRRRRAG